MKICVMSDTHLSASKYAKTDHKTGLNRFLVRQFETLDWIVNYLKLNDINTIVHAGDLFDSSKVTVYPIKRVRDTLSGFDVFAIKGNHDDNGFLHDNEISALDLVGIQAIDTPDIREIGGVRFTFIPWRYEIPAPPDNNMKNVLVTHAFPRDYYNGLPLKDSGTDGVVTTKALLYDLVITGHYHAVDEFDIGDTRFLNPGSISGFANNSADPSIWILDTETLDYKRVKIPCAVKLINVKPSDVNDYLNNISKENIYRIYIDSKENIDRRALLKARRTALDIQFRLISQEELKASDKKECSSFWEYVRDNSSYEEEFRKIANSIEGQ